MRFAFTPQMKKRITRRVVRMLDESAQHFPELQDRVMTVGYTKTKAGVALIPLQADVPLHIRLHVRGLNYNTIGHEMTHLIQGVSRFPGALGSAFTEPLPGGETQCDIWTLARSDLFCDEAPVYLKLPGSVRDRWRDHAGVVRRLCIEAIQMRPNHRTYIRWLESQIMSLPALTRSDSQEPHQFTLPL